MKKYIHILAMVLVVVLGISSIGNCDVAEIIDNLKVARIVSMEIRPLFILTDQSFAGLRAEKVPEDILANPNLLALKDQLYDGREAFVSALEQAVGKDALQEKIEKTALKTLLLRHAKQRPSARTPQHLDVIADIINKNDRDLKLAECTFEFFVHDKEAPGELLKIGTDTVYKNQEIYLESNRLSDPRKVARIKFSAEMGSNYNAAFDPTAHILNFIGRLSQDDHLFIRGRFNLGIKAEKGWTYAEAVKVEWMFCPSIQRQLPLYECFHELPRPISIVATSNSEPTLIACDDLVEAGRSIVKPRTDHFIAEMGQPSGTFRLDFQTYTEPDRIVIEYEGKILFDTGCIGDWGIKSLTYSGNATSMTVTVHSRCDFVGPQVTDWDFRLHCPQ